MLRSIFGIAILLATPLTFANPTALVDFIPSDAPIAVNADLTIGSGTSEKVIRAPWYLFRYSLTNNNPDLRLNLVTFQFKVSGIKNGVNYVTFHSIDPGADCASGYSRPFLAVVEPGETFTGLGQDSSGDPLSHCDMYNKLPSNQFEGWYIDRLASSDDLIYNIEITSEGWFEDVNTGKTTERYLGTGTQTTR